VPKDAGGLGPDGEWKTAIFPKFSQLGHPERYENSRDFGQKGSLV